MGQGGGGGAPHQATAGCHRPGPTQCPVSSAWSLLCLRRSVLHWDHVSKKDTVWHKVCKGGAKNQIRQLFYSLLMGTRPDYSLSPCGRQGCRVCRLGSRGPDLVSSHAPWLLSGTRQSRTVVLPTHGTCFPCLFFPVTILGQQAPLSGN